jgi:hypothetical protein
VLVSRGHLAGLSCAAAVQYNGVAVAWRCQLGCSAVQLSSAVEVGKVREEEEEERSMARAETGR